jgi:hypothetical protein
VLKSGELLYTDANVSFIIDGSIIDAKTRKNVTQARMAQLMKIDFATLPLDQAIKQVRGNGKRVIASFEDPNCGYCKRLAKDLQSLKDATVYTFLYPILSPDSTEKSKNIWCAKDKAAAWNDWMVGGKAGGRRCRLRHQRHRQERGPRPEDQGHRHTDDLHRRRQPPARRRAPGPARTGHDPGGGRQVGLSGARQPRFPGRFPGPPGLTRGRQAGRAAETITLQPIPPAPGPPAAAGVFDALEPPGHRGDGSRRFGHHPLGQAEVPGMADQAAVELDQIRRQCLQAIKAALWRPKLSIATR